MPDEATQPQMDVESRIEEALYPQPTADKVKLEAVPDDSEHEQQVDSEEIPQELNSEDEDEVASEQVEEDEEESIYQQLGVSPDQVGYDEETGEIFFNAKVGDEEYKVPFKDLVKSYQLEKHINNKSVKLSESQKKFDDDYIQFQEQFEAKLNQADEVTSTMEKKLLGEFNNIDWEALRAQDPTQFAVQRQAFLEQAQELKSLQDALKQERDQARQKGDEVVQRKFNEFKQEQANKLLSAYPQWVDPKVMEGELSSARDFALDEYGFTNQEIDGIYDSRIVRMMMDAKSYKSAKKNVEAKTKKSVPKFQKSGSRKGSSQASKAAKERRAELRRTGSQEALTKVLIDRM